MKKECLNTFLTIFLLLSINIKIMVSDPHGGKLVNNVLSKNEIDEIISNLKEYKHLILDRDLIMDAEKIAIGAFSPIDGFLKQEDYLSILDNKRLKNGVVWTLPIILTLNKKDAENFNEKDDIILKDINNNPIALFKLEEKYNRNKDEEAKKIYGTNDKNHPGVLNVYNGGEIILGGQIFLIERPNSDFKEYELTPEQTRIIFKEKNWKTIVGFHTRNVPHRAHEYLQRTALEHVDGLFIHPVIGKKKSGDFTAEAIIKTYKKLINDFYPKEKVLLATLSTYSRYAGPREAVFTALVRKNYGCTHFIVGGDHTGVGNYYGMYDSHKIFDEFSENEIGIKILKFRRPSYCKICQNITTDKTCLHKDENKIEVSGTELRKMISDGILPPEEFIRPEIARLLDKNDFVE